MLKQPDAILKPDKRFDNMVGGVDDSGHIRLMSINDLYDQVRELELSISLPDDIIEQFDKARHAFIYSWFAYDLVSLAEQQGYQVVEMALREKLPLSERKKHRGFRKLIDYAVKNRWLSRADFDIYDAHGQKLCCLDVMIDFRNELAHGSRNLFPLGSLEMLRLCAKVLNNLFNNRSGSS